MPNAVPIDPNRHINSPAGQSTPSAEGIPAPVKQGFALPPPRPAVKQETYSVVVSNVKVQELLFALARDAKINVDIHPGLSGTVTLNALDQTLPQLLARIAKQVDMRFELDGNNLAVMPDSPFLRTYRIDYVNMSRDTTGSVSVTNQIATAGATGSSAQQNQSAGAGNGSSTLITNTAKNRFWETLVQNLKDLLRETDKIFPEGAVERTIESATQGTMTGSSVNAAKPDNVLARSTDLERRTTTNEKTVTFREAAAIIANPETGVISIRATSRQHEKVQEFLTQVLSSARRQVLIEASIVEVELSQNYQKGIDWKVLDVFDTGLRIIQQVGGTLSTPPANLMEVGYNSSRGNFTSSLKFLESFGNVRVLSSPKVNVLNNQSAVLKVVDNLVYFTLETNVQQNQTQTNTTFTSKVHTVPIGLVMTVTPQVSENDTVLLNIRPTITRTVGEGATDPNPELKKEGIVNRIPVVRSRELESILRVNSGNIAIMGGLMEDLLNNSNDTVPGIAQLPVVGGLFENKNDTKKKTELVIFIRPTVIPDSGQSFTVDELPRTDFFDAKNPLRREGTR
ncbi:type II and III secretion system protein [Viridibacterium curvum]|uniref:Type II and III secretion system protein n=1 Tax=Viridibacterium curvum TaxID=1101404 RepID=A0ABP9R160_9RHOO